MLDLQIRRALLDAARAPARDDRERNAALLEHAHAEPVAHVEDLRLLAAAVVDEPAVGQDAVDVEDREAYGFRLEIDVVHVVVKGVNG